MREGLWRRSAAALLGLGLLLGAGSAQAAPRADTGQGSVEGLTVKGVEEFLGIPYAARPNRRPPGPACGKRRRSARPAPR